MMGEMRAEFCLSILAAHSCEPMRPSVRESVHMSRTGILPVSVTPAGCRRYVFALGLDASLSRFHPVRQVSSHSHERISASKPILTNEVFSLTPVNSEAFLSRWSSIFSVILICLGAVSWNAYIVKWALGRCIRSLYSGNLRVPVIAMECTTRQSVPLNPWIASSGLTASQCQSFPPWWLRGYGSGPHHDEFPWNKREALRMTGTRLNPWTFPLHW